MGLIRSSPLNPVSESAERRGLHLEDKTSRPLFAFRDRTCPTYRSRKVQKSEHRDEFCQFRPSR